MEKNLVFFGIVTIFVLLVLGTFCTKNIVEGLVESEKVLTKAICDGKNYCEDYEIYCKGKKIVSLIPTGAAVQFSEEWKDRRSDEEKKISCKI